MWIPATTPFTIPSSCHNFSHLSIQNAFLLPLQQCNRSKVLGRLYNANCNHLLVEADHPGFFAITAAFFFCTPATTQSINRSINEHHQIAQRAAILPDQYLHQARETRTAKFSAELTSVLYISNLFIFWQCVKKIDYGPVMGTPRFECGLVTPRHRQDKMERG